MVVGWLAAISWYARHSVLRECRAGNVRGGFQIAVNVVSSVVPSPAEDIGWKIAVAPPVAVRTCSTGLTTLVNAPTHKRSIWKQVVAIDTHTDLDATAMTIGDVWYRRGRRCTLW